MNLIINFFAIPRLPHMSIVPRSLSYCYRWVALQGLRLLESLRSFEDMYVLLHVLFERQDTRQCSYANDTKNNTSIRCK